MYLIFRSSDALTDKQRLLGVELAVTAPSYLDPKKSTKADSVKDLCYLDLSSTNMNDAEQKEYIVNVFNNIGNLYIDEIVARLIEIDGNNYKNIIKLDQSVPTWEPSRKLDPAKWNSVVRPSWYRAAHQTDLLNV